MATVWRTIDPAFALPNTNFGSRRLPERQPRQYLLADIRQLIDLVHQGKRDTARAGAAQIRELIGCFVGRPDERITANRIGSEDEVIVILSQKDVDQR